MMELLFSYGTLQIEQVQIDTFGRKLKGTADRLSGYKLEQLEIKDDAVLKSSKEKFHPIAVSSDNPEDFVDGMVFEITNSELNQADIYEVEEYKRTIVTLDSGKSVWVYISDL